MYKNIKNIVFDVGGVLMSYRWKEFFMDIGLPEEKAENLGEQIVGASEGWWKQYDLGNISDEELIANYRKKFPEIADKVEFVLNHAEFLNIPRPEVWKKVQELKSAGYGIYILSNYPENHYKKHFMYADFMKYVDGMAVSYQLHMAKPEPEIYMELCRKYGLNPAESVFFDDRKENIDAAKRLGFKAVQAVSENQLLSELKSFLS